MQWLLAVPKKIESETEEFFEIVAAGIDPGAAAVGVAEIFEIGKIGFQIGQFDIAVLNEIGNRLDHLIVFRWEFGNKERITGPGDGKFTAHITRSFLIYLFLGFHRQQAKLYTKKPENQFGNRFSGEKTSF